MCLGIPGRVVHSTAPDPGALRMGLVDFGGATKEVCLEWVPEVQVGDFVQVHAGFAIARLDEEQATATRRMMGLQS